MINKITFTNYCEQSSILLMTFWVLHLLQIKEGKKKKACYNPSESIWQDGVLNLFRVEKTLEKSITKKKTFGKTAFCPKPYLPLTIPKTQLLKFGGKCVNCLIFAYIWIILIVTKQKRKMGVLL